METEIKVGNPWSILPIKNNKYARDLTEVHLSGRGLNALEQFDEFPNLEEIWLNDNKVSVVVFDFDRYLFCIEYLLYYCRNICNLHSFVHLIYS